MNRMIGRTAIGASVAALLSVATSAAMAATGSAPNYGCPTGEAKTTTCVNGGGSSLAANVYTETSPASGIFTSVALPNGGGIGISYEKSSSGAGQAAFVLNDPSQFNGTDAVNGFTVHYAASDAFIDANSKLFPYVGAGKSLPGSGGPFIQVPMFATPITIPVNNARVTANGSKNVKTAGSVAFNDADLCGIFSGKLTNWNQTSAKLKLAAGTINVYWRADNKGSGTTYLLTQHLAAVCNSTNTLAGFKFAATTKFATLFNGVDGVTITTPPSDGATLWSIPTSAHGSFANFVAANGSSGVADGVNNDATSSAIAYLSPDYTSIAKTPAKSTYSTIFVADVLNANDHSAWAPDVFSTKLAIQNPGPTAVAGTPPALTLANAANAANQLNWVSEISNPSHGYPIVGYTNLLVAQCYKNPRVATVVMSMIRTAYTPTSNTLLINNGFQQVIGASTTGWGAAILNAFVKNVGGLNLNINNATVCKGFTGR